MTTPTPRTDATCKAIVAMLEPLRGGTRVTDAEMKAVQGVIDGLAKCATDLERDLATAQAELASVKAERDALKNLLAECETTLAHARVFIGTREKMHPDGQFLYDELLAQVRAQCAAHPKE